MRAIRTPEYFYVLNYFPDRWPAGNPETDFGNCDGSPTKELLKQIGGFYYNLAFGKRPQYELYRIADDPYCMRNLATDPYYGEIRQELHGRMLKTLREEQDPRALGNGAIFDTYRYLGGRGKGYETWLNKQELEPSAE